MDQPHSICRFLIFSRKCCYGGHPRTLVLDLQARRVSRPHQSPLPCGNTERHSITEQGTDPDSGPEQSPPWCCPGLSPCIPLTFHFAPCLGLSGKSLLSTLNCSGHRAGGPTMTGQRISFLTCPAGLPAAVSSTHLGCCSQSFPEALGRMAG